MLQFCSEIPTLQTEIDGIDELLHNSDSRAAYCDNTLEVFFKF